MPGTSRDVLIVSRSYDLSGRALENELNRITKILFQVESSPDFFLSTEVIDLVRNRIISKAQKVKAAFNKPAKPFIFFYNKN